MPAGYAPILPFVIAALAVLLIYRRLRRSFGQQPVRPRRMIVRMGVLAALGVSFIPLAVRSGEFLLVQGAGALAGTALAMWGARRTRYVRRGAQLYYVPHTYAGIAVTLLVFGRLVYRAVQMYSAADRAQGFAPASMVQSPATVGLLFALIGYYVCYYSLVLWTSKRIGAEDLETASTASAP